MKADRARGDYAQGVVPPSLLVMVGLIVALVAGVLLVLQLRGPGDAITVSQTSPTTVTIEPKTSDPLPTAGNRTRGEPVVARPVDARPPSVQPPSEKFASEKLTSEKLPSARPPSDEPADELSIPTTTEAAAPSASSTTVPTSADVQAAAVPSWISIASGRVDGPLTPRGLAPDGTISPARNEIMYFTGSGRVVPGEVGTAVIAAHVSWEGRPDAFVDLHTVVAGDVVTVGYSDGTSRSFAVTSTQVVDKDQLSRSAAVWGSHPDRPRLAIITCDPTLGYQWDGHAEANFVVIADA